MKKTALYKYVSLLSERKQKQYKNNITYDTIENKTLTI